MYMALTEEQARGIRKLGITVIEWKRCIKKSVNVFTYIMNKVVEKATQAWNAIKNAIEELTDGGFQLRSRRLVSHRFSL